MSETKETDGKTIRGSRRMTLNLKRTVDAGHVRQNFSHGRSKSVLVEKKKRRTIAAPGAAATEEAAPTTAQSGADAAAAEAGADSAAAQRELSAGEIDARAKALADARVREEEERRQAEEDAKRLAEEAARAAAQPEPAAAKPAAGKAGRPGPSPRSAKAATPAADKPSARPARPHKDKERGAPGRPSGERRAKDRRVRGKLTINNALDDTQRQRSLASLRRHQQRQKKQVNEPLDPTKKISREIVVPEAITIQELANRMAERAVDVIKFLMAQGQMLKITDVIDADSAELVAAEFGHSVKRVSEADVEEGFIGEDDAEDALEHRAPIVTVMGHVDHGKTSLLDAVREADVVSGEAGGITQHIGAYQVSTGEHKITFIDTPGHEAFTAMRARGAKVTDIVILVVAADDGVKPQTVEAINHAKAAEVPIIVAINKIDKTGADPKRVQTDLLQHDVVVESMGGDVLEIEVSAIEKTNLDKLLDAVLLQAEVLELKANPDRAAEGVVVEAKLERGRGPVGTALVQRGTLGVGDVIVAGSAWGRVRALVDDHGGQVDEAGPAVPVEVLGFDSAPEAGDLFAVVDNEARAREITAYRQRKRRETIAAGTGARGSLEQMMNQLQAGATQEFPLVIKGDVQGSVEAITTALEKLGNDEIRAKIVHAGVGGITESDVTLATASSAPVIGFDVRANAQAREAAEREGIEIRYYAVIYDLIDDIKAAMSGLLAPTVREHFLGNAEVLEVFHISKLGKVAGCRVAEGKVERGANVRIIRDDVVIHEGKLDSLKRFKDDVAEVVAGQECGLGFDNHQDIKAGDAIECFRVEEVERTL